MRIAHISDLHFSTFSFSPTQFLSKRWLGNVNLLLNRRKSYSNKRPFSLLKLFQDLDVTHVLITGDLTTTSHPKEYAMARDFIEKLTRYDMATFLIPGNHDHYTKTSLKKKMFYRYFPALLTPLASPFHAFNLKDHGVAACALSKGWTLVALDTTLATPLYSSNGLFSEKIEKHLKQLLTLVPKNDKIILINHFPFCSSDYPRRRLWRSSKLQEVTQSDPRIQIYLHGHTHKHYIKDLRCNGLPIIIDSGSVSFQQGSWVLLDFTCEYDCDLATYTWENQTWQIDQRTQFQWKTQNSPLSLP